MKPLIILAALSGLFTVALGAFGAHILGSSMIVYNSSAWDKAIMYQMFHSVSILGVAAVGHMFNQKLFIIAGYVMLSGIVFFSGSLYLLSVTSIREFGIITPIGGVLFLVGWMIVIAGMMKTRVR